MIVMNVVDEVGVAEAEEGENITKETMEVMLAVVVAVVGEVGGVEEVEMMASQLCITSRCHRQCLRRQCLCPLLCSCT